MLFADIFADGYIVHNVPGDGDCMFASIALGLGYPHTAETVRRDIVNYLENHLHEVDDIPLQEEFQSRSQETSTAPAAVNDSNEQYLQRLAKRGEWGDGVMLSSACRVYHRPINVGVDELWAIQDEFWNDLPQAESLEQEVWHSEYSNLK